MIGVDEKDSLCDCFLILLFLGAPVAQVTVVDANPYSYPSLWIESPENREYNTTTISVIFHTDTPINHPEIVKMSCSLDGAANRTLSISKSQDLKFGTLTYAYVATGRLTDLSNGTHSLDVYALDSQGTTMTYPTGRTFQINVTPKSKQPSATSNLTFILVMAIIAITIGTISTVTVLKRNMKKIRKEASSCISITRVPVSNIGFIVSVQFSRVATVIKGGLPRGLLWSAMLYRLLD
jgi:hypothetical protein